MKISQRAWMYIGVVASTVILSSSLLTWSLLERNTNNDEQITIATVIDDHSARHEYLVQEEFDGTGLSLELENGKIITNDKLKYDYDFSSAGQKVVNIQYKEKSINYVGYYVVDVFKIRHIDIKNKKITKDNDGNWNLSNMEVWAELSGAPTEFIKPDQYSDLKDTVIILDNDKCEFSVENTDYSNAYFLNVKHGSFTYKSQFRELAFSNASSTSDSLALYVTENTNNFMAPNGSNNILASGYYVLTKGDGTKKFYQFKYNLNGWSSNFDSSSFNEGLVDKQGYQSDNDAYSVEVDGLTFYASASDWHWSILGM